MFKLNHNLVPPIISSYFYLSSDIHCYYTKSRQDYHMYSVTTNIRKRNTRYSHDPYIYSEILLYIL